MKKLTLIATLFIAVAAQSQTADDVIKKYSDAMGGLDKFKAIKTLKMDGSVLVQGMELPITIQIITGKAVRSDVDVMGSSVVSSYKDGKGWKQNPFAGFAEPTDMTDEELEGSKSQVQVSNPLMDYKASGATVELQGRETVEGVETFKVKYVSPADGKETIYFINANDYTLLKSISKMNMMGADVDVETIFSDLKEFGGVKFHLSRVQKIDGEEFQNFQFSSVEVNTAIDEKIFDKP